MMEQLGLEKTYKIIKSNPWFLKQGCVTAVLF